MKKEALVELISHLKSELIILNPDKEYQFLCTILGVDSSLSINKKEELVNKSNTNELLADNVKVKVKK